VTIDMVAVRELAEGPAGPPVLSVHLRTDPRDPANTAHVPEWLVALRNGLRDVSRRLEEVGSRDDRLAIRELRDRVEDDVLSLAPWQRGRGIAWFLSPDGEVDRRLTLQLAPRRHVVRWDDRPFVSPLVDVADRGRATGIVLVGGDAVRLLHWEAGLVDEPERSLYELELADWREFSGHGVGSPVGGWSSGSNETAYEQRVDAWRDRFLREAATAVGGRVHELGWDRVVLVSEGQVAGRFAAELPDDVGDRVVAEVEANLLLEAPAAVSDRLEGTLDTAWRQEVTQAATRAAEAAYGGGPGAVGWGEVLGALLERRVSHLIVDPDAAPGRGQVNPLVLDALGRPGPDFLAERAVELAVAADARVTALDGDDVPALLTGGGVLAELRW